MDLDFIVALARESIMVLAQIGGPILAASMAVGLTIAVFQAATQVNEMTLVFVPKIVVTLAVLAVGAAGMIKVLAAFTRLMFSYMVTLTL